MADSRMPFPRMLKQLDQDRRRRYAQNLAFFQGQQWQHRPRSQNDRQLTFNYADTILTAVAGLVSDHVRISVTAPLEQPEEAARAANLAWQRVAEENALTSLDFETELDAAIMGDACYKVTWDVDADSVRVTSPDVQGLFAWWMPDNPNVLTQVAQQYRVPSSQSPLASSQYPAAGSPFPSASLRTGSRLRVSGSKEVTVTERWTGLEYDLWIDDALVVTGPNPYGFIPYVLYANIRDPKQFWGKSDLARLEDVQRELNRELSTLSVIMQLSGNPIAVLENVENAKDIAIHPGAVWEIPEHARAYVLDLLARGGAKLHIDYVQLLYRALHDLTQTPRSAFGDLGRSISGVAMELDMAPLTRQVKRKRLTREAAYRRRTELALRLLQDHGQLEPGPYSVLVTWGDILPRDPSQETSRFIDQVSAGLRSHTGAMAALGQRDPDEEWAKAKQEQAEWAGVDRLLTSDTVPINPASPSENGVR